MDIFTIILLGGGFFLMFLFFLLTVKVVGGLGISLKNSFKHNQNDWGP